MVRTVKVQQGVLLHRVAFVCLLGIALSAGGTLSAQEATAVPDNATYSALSSPVNPLLPGTLPSSSGSKTATTCQPYDLEAAPELSFQQRTCLLRARLLSRSFPLRAAAFSAISEIRRNNIREPGLQDFSHRFAVYYARRTAQSTGEFLAGYLNHEDPRYHPSLEHGVWRRSRSALLSVLVTRDPDGGSRMAFAPIAGAFGSGMVSVACYRYHNSLDDGLRRSAGVYGMYFGTALLREFRPELSGLAARFLRRR